jgi:hypothetical protein
MDSRSPAYPASPHAPGAWGDANSRGVAFAAVADWRQAAAAFADAASTLSHEALHGAPTDALALVLSNLAHACARDGRAEEAIDHAHRALEVREALAGPASPLAARTRMDLAVLLASTGALGEARSLLDAALRQLETTFGTGDVRLLGVLENSARLSLMTGEVERAAADVRRLRGVMELHEVPTDRLVALTDRLHAAGVPLDEVVGDRGMAPDHQAEEALHAEGFGEPWSAGEDTGVEGWRPTDIVEMEPPAPWVPEAAPQPLWDAGDGIAVSVPSPDGDAWDVAQLEAAAAQFLDGDPMSPLVPGKVGGGDVGGGDAGGLEGGSLGLAELLDEDPNDWPPLRTHSGVVDAPPEATPAPSPTASVMGSLVEDHLGALSAELPADSAVSSLWDTLLGGDGDAADRLDDAQAWELPEPSPWIAKEPATVDSAFPASSNTEPPPPRPFPQGDDIPWLDAGDAPHADHPPAGRLLDEPEPEIPDFLRADQGTLDAGAGAMAASPSIPAPPSQVEAAWEDEDQPHHAPVGAYPGRPQPGLLPLVPDGARWGQTGARTPHEGSVSVNPSPVSKYDEILHRVQKQARQHRAGGARASYSRSRVLVLSVVTVATLGVGGGLWWTLLR